MIRGKVISDREVIPQEVTIGEGEPLFVQRGNKWFKKDGTQVQVDTKSLIALFSEIETPTTEDEALSFRAVKPGPSGPGYKALTAKPASCI